MKVTIAQKFWAELIGTWVLVLIGCGSVVALVTLQGGGAGKTSLADLFAIGLTFGVAVAAMIYAVGHISGTHINPAVTFALAVTGRLPWSEVLPYVLAQLIGAVGGALTLAVVFGSQAVAASGLGAPGVGAGYAAWQAYAAELVGTFVLVFAIFGAAVDGRAPGGWAGWAIAAVVCGLIVAMGPVSGQGINPARSFGPYLVDTLYGKSVNWLDFLLGYALCPLLGGALGGVAYDAVSGLRREAAANARKAAAAQGD